MKRIMIVMGTRPEAIKLGPLIRELESRGCFEVTVCTTGQHRAMLDSALRIFEIKPDFDLGVMQSGQSLTELCAVLLNRTDALLESQKPDFLLVQGDTASAYAASLAAFYRGIPIGHVEAGLRTYRMDAPFPEEFHRQSIGMMATLHFAPTPRAKRNLIREGREESTVHVTGNTVVDALRLSLSGTLNAPPWHFSTDKRVILFTAHRRENFGEPMRGMMRALCRVIDEYPDTIAVCPLHPNPAVQAAARDILGGRERICMVAPPDFVSFHRLLVKSYLIMTDSGGVQEETVSLGIPTVVMRYSSERTEGLRAGVLKLAGNREDAIYQLVKRLLEPGSEEYTAMKKPSSVFGDGKASARIADLLEQFS